MCTILIRGLNFCRASTDKFNMKTLRALILMVPMMAACEEQGVNQPASVSAPSAREAAPEPIFDEVAPTPTPMPVASPTPTPVMPAPSPSPTLPPPPPTFTAPVDTVQTSSSGSYGCYLRANGKVHCWDGSNEMITAATGFVRVQVGPQVTCAIQNQGPNQAQLQPQSCTSLSAAGCQRPSSYYFTYCWANGSSDQTAMQTQTQVGNPSNLQTWVTGPSILSVVNGKTCINQDVYDLHSNPYGRRTTIVQVCGDKVNKSNGYLEHQ